MVVLRRSFLFAFIDFILIISAVLFSEQLLRGTVLNENNNIFFLIAVLLVTHYACSFAFSSYKKVWQYASFGEFITLIKTITLTMIASIIILFSFRQSVEVFYYIETYMLLLLLIGGSRLVYRLYKNHKGNTSLEKERVLIVGAGSAGQMVARQLLNDKHSNLLPVAFIDDDSLKEQMQILGIPVAGKRNDIQKVVEKYGVEKIVIAIPSLPRDELRKVVDICLHTGIKTQTIPRLEDLILGNVPVNELQDIKVEDLLGREPVELDTQSISDHLFGKTILVTGAGGSIGSEICRQVAKFQPKKLILLGHGENSIYTIRMELEESYRESQMELHSVIADIKDEDKMFFVMRKYQPHIVYHAAAHKHVPLMEDNPEEAVKNNIIGTLNVARAANWSGVRDFVMISTDKAVNPTSVMGASKRIAEILIQHLNQESFTKYVAVRFGNVLGSRGSVIPLFKMQIQKGGPVTVTHPEMVRYFMTIPEASRLVLQAGALAEGGEIFVLDMGEPVKIVDLAKKLILLSGYTVEEIGIEYTGIRPGEKLYEEILNDSEKNNRQVYPKIFVGKSVVSDVSEIFRFIDELPKLSREEIRERLLYLGNDQYFGKKLAVQ